MPREYRFDDAALCAAALTQHVGDLARDAIAARGESAVVVSGGKTPLPFFERLHTLDIEWAKVKVTLADERWVDGDDPASNETFVRKNLLRARAAALTFIGLKNAAQSAADGAASAWARLVGLARPFEAVLLGMGDDGHTASLFPNSPGLIAALDPAAAPACVAMQAPSAPQDRLSLNLAALMQTRSIVLLISGDEKWRTYERARDGRDVAAMPVRAILHQQSIPVEVYWTR
jgi:6-phosphogluconolactonase